MKSRFTLLMLFGSLPLYIFCQDTQPGNKYDHSFLFANSWNLTELNGISTEQPGITQAYIIFKPGDDMLNRIAGFTGCNYFIGRVDFQGADEIAFHPDILTYNNCAGSSVESQMIQTLLNVDSWSEKKGQLLLHQKGKVIARFDPSASINKNLSGMWQLYYIRDHSAPFTELYPVDNRPSMIFTEGKNMVSGFAGCHEFMCSVMVNGNSMVFAEYPMQDTTCHGNGENIFLTNLNSVNAYGFKDDKTLVLIADDKPVLAFTRIKGQSVVYREQTVASGHP